MIKRRQTINGKRPDQKFNPSNDKPNNYTTDIQTPNHKRPQATLHVLGHVQQ